MQSLTNHRPIVLAFDLDGTIIPTTEPEMQKMIAILHEIGLPLKDRKILAKNWGLPLAALAEKVIAELGGNDSHIKDFINLTHARKAKIPYDREISVVLDKLRPKYPLALITSRTRYSLAQVATEFHFPSLQLFHFVQALDECRFHKPDSRVFGPLQKWAKRWPADKIVYFGDTVRFDWAATRDHDNIEFVGVVSGATKASEFLAHGISDIVLGVNGLTDYLITRFNK